jgi:hypothetical protein
MNILHRIKYRILTYRDTARSLNRKVVVESYLLNCASGRKPLPNQETCRRLALYLGTHDTPWPWVVEREDK